MKPLVVLGGVVLVAGTAMAGLSKTDSGESRIAGLMASITGEETNKNVRRPVWASRNTVPGAIAGAKMRKAAIRKPVKTAQVIAPVKIMTPVKASVSDVATRKIVAALSGIKPDTKTAQEPAKTMAAIKAVSTTDLAKQKAADKLVETIKKKAIMAAKQPAEKKLMARVKKNIGYDRKKRNQPALVSVAPKVPATVMVMPQVMAKPVIKIAKPTKPATQVALLTKKERTDLGKLVKDKKLPALDVTIEFDYKSSTLSDKALPQLARIGQALTDGQLADATFVIAGHTDSVGGSKYNMGLSSKRAMAVLDYLKNQFKIADKRLVAVGYGEERLKNSTDSKAAENRRVEFITLVR